MSNSNETKAAIIAHLLKEKEASYRNMISMQESEVNAAEKANEADDSMYEGGKSDQTLNRVEARSSVVEALQKEIDLLSGLSSITPTGEVQLGDVVETDQGNFFVAVPSDEFTIDGKTYRGISTDSPLYLALRGKKNGEVAMVSDNAFTLRNSY